ncbi:membrane protein [Beggiatoa sp. PS]|nr:membrane protein [Beggiatoa sp. PS]
MDIRFNQARLIESNSNISVWFITFCYFVINRFNQLFIVLLNNHNVFIFVCHFSNSYLISYAHALDSKNKMKSKAKALEMKIS